MKFRAVEFVRFAAVIFDKHDGQNFYDFAALLKVNVEFFRRDNFFLGNVIFKLGAGRMFLHLAHRQQDVFAGKIFIAVLNQLYQRELFGVESKNFFADVQESAADSRLVGVRKFCDEFKILCADIVFRPNRQSIRVARRQVQKFGVLLRQQKRFFKRNERAAVFKLRGVFEAQHFQFCFDRRRKIFSREKISVSLRPPNHFLSSNLFPSYECRVFFQSNY